MRLLRRFIRDTRVALLPALLGALSCASPPDATADIACSEPALRATLPAELTEASGIAPASQAGHAWVINDSEPALLYRIDAEARVRQRVRVGVRGASDWEDLAAARCPLGRCLYIADIGDNLHQRPVRYLLRLREPAPGETDAAQVARFPFRYPDGPADAEALFILPGERVHVITKGRNRAPTLYRYPGPLRPDTVTLERLRTLAEGVVQVPDMVTGAAARPDGRLVLVRTYSTLFVYTVGQEGDVAAEPALRVPLGALGEPQGEGVAIRAGGDVLLVSERGPGGAPAPLSALRCGEVSGPAGGTDGATITGRK